METLTELAINFWQWSILIILIIIGFVINLFDKKIQTRIGFKYTDYPVLKPLPIKTKGKGFFKMLTMWLFGVRHWEIVKDFEYELRGETYVIPKGFQFDGASIPKFLHTFLSPVGVLLIGGLVHDYAYKYETLLKKNKKDTMGIINQKKADEIFRDVNIEINGFYLMNMLAFWSLRIGGFAAWKKHRKAGSKI
tara:strand:- start:459 stop:1037 length:579 start_codon:yes stop_codon:yes gene_type:complete